ncbi:MAG: hypothetical protein DRG82_15625 [Deltaproteobacteria bacterium]|nr:MAG: hypothetical protein DRG82_15625 [Deltaproteobacteria bacterium]
MFEKGTTVKMTKGYRGLRGEILEKTGSSYDLYVVKLENGIHLVAGPSAFVPKQGKKEEF